MEKNIYNIGKIRYLMTVLLGSHSQIIKETIETKDDSGEIISVVNPCDFIITRGKSAVIMTKPNSNNPNNRVAHVVKRWKFIGNVYKNNLKMQAYIDIEGHKWFYLKDNKGEMITYYKNVAKIFHFET